MARRGDTMAGIAAARPSTVAVALSVTAALMAIPQAFVVGDLVALAALGAGAGLTGLGPGSLVAALAAVGLVRVLLDAAAGDRSARDAIRYKRDLRRRWLTAVAGWSPVAGARASAGEIAATVSDQVETLDPYFSRFALSRARMMVVPVAVVLATAPVSWVVALLLLVSGPLLPLFLSLIGARARELGRRRVDEAAGLTGLLLDRVRGLATIRALGADRRVAADLAATGERLRQRTMSVLAVAFLSSAVLEFFASVGIALAAIYVGFTLMGWLSVGAGFGLAGGVAVLMLAPEFFQPFRDFAAAYHDRAAALSLGDRARVAIEADVPRLALPAVALAPAEASSPVAVRVRGLGVADPATGRRLLDGVDLDVAAGEHVALTGPSGAGKSMLLMSVAGLVVPAEGTVHVDGRPSSGGGPPVGWIAQEPFVLAGSLLRNLSADGLSAVPRAEADAALAAVGLANVVAAMPRGLLTPLGEAGAGLSRGELRRVTIARVLIAGTGLIIADEPTADLDAETAAEVAGALLAAARGRTLIVATHDPALAARMDRVLRVEDGRLAEAAS